MMGSAQPNSISPVVSFDGLLPKPTVCPLTSSGRTVICWNHVTFPLMLSPSTAVHPELVEGERRLRTGLSKHEIYLGNSPLRYCLPKSYPSVSVKFRKHLFPLDGR